ncbi:uncharacterized protein si:ch211-133n4.6 [Osmerus eperlanus]|uniref:uncharacterized protein si:ch211-133n4.6 n=2 Tax=Osmerus TaxID=8013 RepID=UPI002E12E8CD
MPSRNILIFLSLVVLLVEAELDTNDGGIQAMSTDKDSTSDEAPTESMNAVSPDHPNDEPLYDNRAAADASSTSAEAAPEAPKPNVVNGAGAAANSVEDDDEDDDSDSDEGARKRIIPRASKSQKTVGTRSKPQSTRRRSRRPSGRQI